MATRDRGHNARPRAFSFARDILQRVRLRSGSDADVAAASAGGVFPWLARSVAFGAIAGLALGLLSVGRFPVDFVRVLARAALFTLLGGIFGGFVGMISAVERRFTAPESERADDRELWDSWVDDQEDTTALARPNDAKPTSLHPRPDAPERSAVRPRVICTDGGSLPLEDEVWPLVKSGCRGTVRIWGGPGTGKTTALRHLAAILPPEAQVVLLDRPEPAELAAVAEHALAIYTSGLRLHPKEIAAFGLALWGNDELIEYLLAANRDRCASVMERLKDDIPRFDGMLAAELWRVILDRMLVDDSASSVRQAIRLELGHGLGDGPIRLQVAQECLEAITSGTTPPGPMAGGRLERLLRHRLVVLLMAAEYMAAALADDDSKPALGFLSATLPRDLVEECAPLVALSPRAIERLKLEVRSKCRSHHALSASLLHAARTGWVPEPGSRPNLAGAYLAGADWPRVDLSRATLTSANLARANLEGADLLHAILTAGRLHLANLRGAHIACVSARGVRLTAADLSYARARKSDFRDADFERANLEGAWLRFARLERANFSHARLADADLTGAKLEGAQLERANLTGAELNRADLRGLTLSSADLTGAHFQAARMEDCKLVEIELPGADFEDAVLLNAEFTGSRMPKANFRGADLRLAKLADVHWPDACLRDADLRGAQFHMGTTRSGLVGSAIPCEGSRTGFYTDDYQDREHLPPEEIRKANLCGADLRGADVEGADFYLVDLRGAQFSPDQAHHFRRCGAILDGKA